MKDMTALIFLGVVILLFGCLQERTKEGTGDVVKYTTTDCTNVTRQSTDCMRVNFNYSTGTLGKLDPYNMDVFCIGGATLSVKNLEKEGGIFRVTFIFTTPKEGTSSKTVEKAIAAKGTATFEEKIQFSCSQDYGAEYQVTPPTKQVCRPGNFTIEECIVH